MASEPNIDKYPSKPIGSMKSVRRLNKFVSGRVTHRRFTSQNNTKRRISIGGSDDDNAEILGNLGSIFLKRFYLLIEIGLDMAAIANLSAYFEYRWHITYDRAFIILMLVFNVISLLVNLVLCFSLAFANLKVQPHKDKIQIYRPIWILGLAIPNLIFVMENNMFVMFNWCVLIFSAKIAIGGQLLMEHTVPNILLPKKEKR